MSHSDGERQPGTEQYHTIGYGDPRSAGAAAREIPSSACATHSLWLPLAQQGTSGVWAVRNAILKLIFYRLYVL